MDKDLEEVNTLTPVFYVFIEALKAAEILDREDIVLQSMGYRIWWKKVKDDDIEGSLRE